MTQAQYDTAKDILLDLLGWGVPPEYLLNCGLSREIIYYVFIELNLRLPANLDTTGLPPPLPPQHRYMYSSPEPVTPPAHTAAPSRTRGASLAKRSVGEPHPSLPQKPAAPQGPSSSGDGTPLSATAAPFVPSASLSAVRMQSSDSPTPPSLIDMEQQRRQELLARKAAVLASRKKQIAAAASSISVTSTTAPSKEIKQNVATPPVAQATVDDFLSTIGPVNGDSGSKESEHQMDVDDQIPGLSAGPALPPSRLSEARSESSDSLVAANNVIFPPPSESDGSVRSNSVERNAALSNDSSSSGGSTPRLSSVGPRRGTKRPVAADFVDMEPGSSRSHAHHHAHHVHNHHPYRRKPTTFAGLSAHSRRMVIDLSDSEEEAEDAINSFGATASQQPSRPPTRLGTSASLPTGGTTLSSGVLATPTALLEKEQEIKKMRELIAQRERARLDKLTAVCESSRYL